MKDKQAIITDKRNFKAECRKQNKTLKTNELMFSENQRKLFHHETRTESIKKKLSKNFF